MSQSEPPFPPDCQRCQQLHVDGWPAGTTTRCAAAAILEGSRASTPSYRPYCHTSYWRDCVHWEAVLASE